MPFGLFSQKYWVAKKSSQLTNSYFSEGWPNHQPDIVYSIITYECLCSLLSACLILIDALVRTYFRAYLLHCETMSGRPSAAAHQARTTSCDCRFRGTSLPHGRVKPGRSAAPFPGAPRGHWAYTAYQHHISYHIMHDHPAWCTYSISSGS